AEDGIRDWSVTGVQTCALPIFGLKTSWLSREIVAFGLFAGCALVYAGSFWLPVLSQWVSPPLLREWCSSPLRNALGLGVALTGQIGRASCRERGETAGEGGG